MEEATTLPSLFRLLDAISLLHDLEPRDFLIPYEVPELKAGLLHLFAGICAEQSRPEMPSLDVGPEPMSQDEAQAQLGGFIAFARQALNSAMRDGSNQVGACPLPVLAMRATTFAILLDTKAEGNSSS